MSAGAVAVVEDAAGGIQFIQHRLRTLARGSCGRVFRVGGDELLGERRVAHVEEFARLIQLPASLTDVPLAREFDEDPIAWRGLGVVVGQLEIAGLFHNEPDAPARANRCRK